MSDDDTDKSPENEEEGQKDVLAIHPTSHVIAELEALSAICYTDLQKAAANTYIANFTLLAEVDEVKSQEKLVKKLWELVAEGKKRQSNLHKLEAECEVLRIERNQLHLARFGKEAPPPYKEDIKNPLDVDQPKLRTKKWSNEELEEHKTAFIKFITGNSPESLSKHLQSMALENAAQEGLKKKMSEAKDQQDKWIREIDQVADALQEHAERTSEKGVLEADIKRIKDSM